MPVSNNIIEIEGQRGCLQILMALHQRGEILYGNLYNNEPFVKISNNSTAKRAIEVLMKYNLILKRKNSGRKAIYFKLTQKGVQFAELVNKMDRMLQE